MVKFPFKDLPNKCEQICSLLRVYSHLLKKCLTVNSIFCTVKSLESLLFSKDYRLENFKKFWIIKIMKTIANPLKSKAAIQTYPWEKVFWQYAANLQENTKAEVWFQ